MSKKKAKFATVIYVIKEHDGDDTYLLASERIDNIDEGVVVAVYCFDQTYKMGITRELV